jgi:hypothetical protein
MESPSPALIKALITGPQLKGVLQLTALVTSPGGVEALVSLLVAMGHRGLQPPSGWLEGAQRALAGCCRR